VTEESSGEKANILPYYPLLSEKMQRPLQSDIVLLIKLNGITPALSAALVSLREAIEFSDLTGMFAFRAVEAVRDYFKQEHWPTLNLHRSWAEEMTLYAKPQRHGTDKAMSAAVRETLLRRAYAVVDRFTIYLRDGDTSQIAVLPQLYCDGKGTLTLCLDPACKNHKLT